MAAGRLRHPIVIQEESRISDGMGGWQVGWADVSREWASIEALRGQELIAGQTIHAQTDLKVTIRYRDGIKSTKCRIKYGNRLLDIQAALPDNKMAWLTLLCSEGMPV